MGKALLNKVYLSLYLLIGSLVLEVVNFYLLNLGVMPDNIWYDMAIIVFITLIIAALPSYILQYILSTFVLLVQAILIYANYSLQTIYKGEIFTFDMLSLLREGMGAMSSSFIYMTVALQIVGVFLVIAIIGSRILAYCRKQKISFKKRCFVSVAVLAFCALGTSASAGAISTYRDLVNSSVSITDEEYVLSNAFLMGSPILKENAYKKYGTFGFYTNLLLNNSPIDDSTENAVTKYFNDGEIYDNSSVFGLDKNNNVITIMMESLEWFGFGDGSYHANVNNLSSELTPNLYSLIYANNGEDESKSSILATNFFAKAKTNYSETYGILGNYPVAQNLTDIAGNGYNVDNHAFDYSLPNVLNKLGYTTTYAHSNTLDFYKRNETHENLGFTNLVGKNTLEDEDGNLKYTGDDLSFDHWMCEGDFALEAIDQIVPKSVLEGVPFYSFYLTVSTHGAYIDNANNKDQLRFKNYVLYGADDCVYNEELGIWELKQDSESADDAYIDNITDDTTDNSDIMTSDDLTIIGDEENLVETENNDTENSKELSYTDWYTNIVLNYGEDENLVNQLVNYQCGVMGLDEAIGVIIDKLKEYDIYDNTTIVLYADHNAYYENLSNRVKGIETWDTSRMIELNTVPFILSSPGLKSRNVEFDNRFCSAYDIIPTILDLLGIKFNQNFYIGRSLFSDIEKYEVIEDDEIASHGLSIYYSNTGGMYCQDVYTSNLNNYYNQNSTFISDCKPLFKTEATKLITKLNYLNLLNNNQTIYKQLTNNFGYLTEM